MGNFNDETMDILLKFLDKKSQKAMKEIEEKGTLSEENAIPLILKTQFNHIAHLDTEITNLRQIMDQRFEKMDQRFEKIDQRFESMQRWFTTVIGIGFTVIAALIVIFQFI